MLLHSSKFKVLLAIIFSWSLFSFDLLANTSQLGKTLYQQCIVCHGSEGQGNAQLNTPAIAGQYAW